MRQQDYTVTIPSNVTPDETIERIGRVPAWWTNGFRGAAQNVGDTFSVRFGETFVDFKVVERSRSRVVWRATDCNLHFIENKKEWRGTEVVFDISSQKGETVVRMTHKGLAPHVECYGACEKGWNFYAGESLRKLLTQGSGLPDGEHEQPS